VTSASRLALIIDDEPQIRVVLRALLKSEQFRVIEADTAGRGISEAQSHKPDLIILELGLPDRDGLQVIRAVRGWSQVPIIVLSARVSEAAKVAALKAGADDYVTKPFAARELSARLHVALRHAAHTSEGGYAVTIGKWQIDLHARTVLANDGSSIHLTPIEFRLLEILARHIGYVVTRQQILRHVWGPGCDAKTHYLRIHMKHLRQKLEPDSTRPSWLVTQSGVGYRLVQHS
jgi:two-component system, OmpR family, KDP operon response regulator KdpE